MNHNSHRTAITRKGLSAPARMIRHEIEDTLRLGGRVLDYGCGKGVDAKLLGVESYDSYYQQIIPDGRFDLVYCFYVLNTLPVDEAQKVVEGIQYKMKSDGLAYVAVRRDVVVEGKTKKGTFQRNVELRNANGIAYKKGHYEIYWFTKQDEVEVL